MVERFPVGHQVGGKRLLKGFNVGEVSFVQRCKTGSILLNGGLIRGDRGGQSRIDRGYRKVSLFRRRDRLGQRLLCRGQGLEIILQLELGGLDLM